MGAGLGALLAGAQLPPGSPLMTPLQMGGIVLMVGSIALRMALSQAGLQLMAHAGLLSNYACLFAAGLTVMLALQRVSDLAPAIAVVVLGWMPVLALTVIALAVSAPWRRKAAPQTKE